MGKTALATNIAYNVAKAYRGERRADGVMETKDGGIFAPLASGGGTAFDNVRVDYKGTISIPYVGRVKVAGLDPQQVEDRLRSRLAGVSR